MTFPFEARIKHLDFSYVGSTPKSFLGKRVMVCAIYHGRTNSLYYYYAGNIDEIPEAKHRPNGIWDSLAEKDKWVAPFDCFELMSPYELPPARQAKNKRRM